jgi:hypothetical protein
MFMSRNKKDCARRKDRSHIGAELDDYDDRLCTEIGHFDSCGDSSFNCCISIAYGDMQLSFDLPPDFSWLADRLGPAAKTKQTPLAALNIR